METTEIIYKLIEKKSMPPKSPSANETTTDANAVKKITGKNF